MQDKPVALVTGANQGIGLQIAKDLVTHGFAVLVGSRNLERGEAPAKEVGPHALALQLEVTEQASITAAAERIRNEFGRLDVLVNNAAISNTRLRPCESVEGYSKSTRASVVSLDEVHSVFETNVFGVVTVTQAMLPLLREAPTAPIVNVSSGALADAEFGPCLPLPLDLWPRLPCLQDGSQCHDARHGDRTGVERNQGQRCVPGLHEDESQQPCGHADCRGGCPRAGAPCASRPGRSDSHVLEHSRTAPLVMWSRACEISAANQR
jgi:NAD(P)-dependent dehydrogenase (short-subunit alcohol dehydrogenase family)